MDWNYVNTLLAVIHQATAAGPKYAKIAALADAELTDIFAPPPPEEATAPVPEDGSTEFTGDDGDAPADEPVAALPPVNGRRV